MPHLPHPASVRAPDPGPLSYDVPAFASRASHRGPIIRPLQRIFGVAGIALCWLLSLLALGAAPASAQTAMQLYVEAMQPGWNLGNTLDATPTETSWGNPPATQALIQQIKAQGFKSIRIPVTWEPHMGPGPDHTVDPAWMDRVQQIVDWSLDAGLLVMLNVHHDSYWVRAMPADHDAVLARFNALWSQIAPRFRDYPNTLMLESINEPTFDGAADAAQMALLQELNTSFFHIVRGTGGGNATRPLVLPSLNTNSGQQYLDSLKATMTALNDPNLIATTHYYGYWPFSVNITGATTVTAAVVNDINDSINNVYNTFVAHGIPVVVGELGILNYNRLNSPIERGELLKYFEIYTAAARAKGVTWQLWDAGGQFDRLNNRWLDPELFAYYMQGLSGRSGTASTDLVFVKSGAPADVSVTLNPNGNTFASLSRNGTVLAPGNDYTLSGNTLTLKSALLAPYSSGVYGERTVLDVNFSSGLPWKLHVRHLGAPLSSAALGTKGLGVEIPFAFNGDVLEKMEARYAGRGYPYPGPANWTSFQVFGETYLPDYANNTITVTKNFFDSTTNDPIDLTFHLWSGREVTYRLNNTPGGNLVTNPQELAIYGDSPAAGWSDQGSWTPHNLSHAGVVQSGANSIEVTAGAWGALGLSYSGPALDTSAYKTLTFWIHGGAVGGQSIGVFAQRSDPVSGPWVGIAAPAANTWRKVEIPLEELGVEGSPDIRRIFFQNGTGSDAPTFYIDDIRLTTAYASHLVFVEGVPPPAIRLEIQGLARTADARIQFTVTGTAGLPYAIERSTDLTTWQTVANGTVTTPAGAFAETQSQAGAARRFYRARQTGDAP